MKKVFSALVLTSFLAVLAVPIMVSAAGNCPNQNCEGPIPSTYWPCLCGDNTSVNSAVYCWGTGGNGAGRIYTDQTSCSNARSGGTTGTTGGSITTVAGLQAKLEQISTWVFNILLVIAGIFLIVAGYFFVTGGGEPEKVTKARQMLINALIGVAIAVAAKGLVMLVQNIVQ